MKPNKTQAEITKLEKQIAKVPCQWQGTVMGGGTAMRVYFQGR